MVEGEGTSRTKENGLEVGIRLLERGKTQRDSDVGAVPVLGSFVLNQIVSQVVGQAGMTKPTECFLLQLADALSTETELVSNLLQRVGFAATKTKTQAQNMALTRCKLAKHFFNRRLEQVLGGSVYRARGILILDKIAKLTVAVLPHRAF